MNRFKVRQTITLQQKELWENRNLIIGAPMVMAIVIFVVNFLIGSQLGVDEKTLAIDFSLRWFDGKNPFSTNPILTLWSLPFVLVFFFCSAIYLLNSLYQDRKDMSILFWQSMPVSNLQTVISKLVTVIVVSPALTALIMGLLYSLMIVFLAFSGLGTETQVGFLYMLTAAWINVVVVYFFLATSALWLLPLMGWLLLFSSFARRAPMLWAVGVYFAIGFAEEFIFSTQFVSNWAQTRFDPDNFLIIDFTGIADRFFSYEMFVGCIVGSLLITGAVYMRRYVD
ncbi:MAG: hypothetical protein AB8B95_01245 [Pseudohongiellaceae bacterium]